VERKAPEAPKLSLDFCKSPPQNGKLGNADLPERAELLEPKGESEEAPKAPKLPKLTLDF
jgi:hypothetical protein